MARLVAPFNLKGKVGTMSFAPQPDGTCSVKQTRGSSKKAFRDKDSYELARWSAAEFSRCTGTAKKLKDCVGNLPYLSDPDYFSRLVGLLSMVSSTAPGGKGAHHCLMGDLRHLEGYNFNKNRLLEDAISTHCFTDIDREQGKVVLELDPFVPHKQVKGPAGAAYFQVVLWLGGLAGGKPTGITMMESPLLSMNAEDLQHIRLEGATMPPPEEGILFAVAGIRFYEDYKGLPAAIKGGASEIKCVELFGEVAALHMGLPDGNRTMPALPVHIGKKLDKTAPSSNSAELLFPGYNERMEKLKAEEVMEQLQRYKTGR